MCVASAGVEAGAELHAENGITRSANARAARARVIALPRPSDQVADLLRRAVTNPADVSTAAIDRIALAVAITPADFDPPSAQHHDRRELLLIGMLRNIVMETMAHPPIKPLSGDSYLPAPACWYVAAELSAEFDPAASD